MQQDAVQREIRFKAFDMARTWSGLVVTLSTGGIVFTAIFRKDFAPQGQALEATGYLLASWVGFGLAAVCGVLFLSTMVATLAKADQNELDVYGGAMRFVAVVQLLSFAVGVSALLTFLVLNLGSSPIQVQPTSTPSPA